MQPLRRNEKSAGKKGIDSTEKITLGSIEQWISLRSDDTENPLILFLHGGPGTAQIGFSRKPQRMLEKYFLVVNWDQRGAGRSYSKRVRREDMTIQRFVSDAEELDELLLKRFGQKKVFLVVDGRALVTESVPDCRIEEVGSW